MLTSPKTASDNLESLFKKSDSPEGFIRSYSEYVGGILSATDPSLIIKAAEQFMAARKRDNIIYFIGNGGSASIASHFAQDLADVAKKANVPAFRSISLTDNTSYITALGNDYGYEKVFTEQLKALFRKGDVLVAISSSGNSRNIVESVRLAKQLGGTCIGFVGFDGGELARLADCAVHVKTPKGEYGPVEGLHAVIMHMITSYLYFTLRQG